MFKQICSLCIFNPIISLINLCLIDMVDIPLESHVSYQHFYRVWGPKYWVISLSLLKRSPNWKTKVALLLQLLKLKKRKWSYFCNLGIICTQNFKSGQENFTTIKTWSVVKTSCTIRKLFPKKICIFGAIFIMHL